MFFCDVISVGDAAISDFIHWTGVCIVLWVVERKAEPRPLKLETGCFLELHIITVIGLGFSSTSEKIILGPLFPEGSRINCKYFLIYFATDDLTFSIRNNLGNHSQHKGSIYQGSVKWSLVPFDSKILALQVFRRPIFLKEECLQTDMFHFVLVDEARKWTNLLRDIFRPALTVAVCMIYLSCEKRSALR